MRASTRENMAKRRTCGDLCARVSAANEWWDRQWLHLNFVFDRREFYRTFFFIVSWMYYRNLYWNYDSKNRKTTFLHYGIGYIKVYYIFKGTLRINIQYIKICIYQLVLKRSMNRNTKDQNCCAPLKPNSYILLLQLVLLIGRK